MLSVWSGPNSVMWEWVKKENLVWEVCSVLVGLKAGPSVAFLSALFLSNKSTNFNKISWEIFSSR